MTKNNDDFPIRIETKFNTNPPKSKFEFSNKNNDNNKLTLKSIMNKKYLNQI